jgi:hypothetical protein
LKALVVYHRDGQHLPFERTSEIFLDVYGINVSAGALVDIVRDAEKSRVLDDFE